MMHGRKNIKFVNYLFHYCKCNPHPKTHFPNSNTNFSLNTHVHISHNVLGVHEVPAYEISGTHNGSVDTSPGILLISSNLCGVRGGVVVEALRYKPAGRGFDFSVT